MRRLLIPAVLLALFSFAGVAVAQDFDAAGEAEVLSRINALRAENQLPALQRLDTLDAVARAHSAEMARSGQLAHVSPNTGSPEDRVRGAGVAAQTIAENVANHRDSVSAHDALLASAPHRSNILDPNVTHVGLGSVASERGVFMTQVFAQLPPEPASAPALAAPPVEAQVAPVPEPTIEAVEEPSPFALIPPFVEQAVDAASSVPEQAAGALLGAGQPEAAPPLVPEIETEPTEASPDAAQAEVASPEPTPGADSSRPNAELTPAAASTLRQLVGLAQALLGGASSDTRD